MNADPMSHPSVPRPNADEVPTRIAELRQIENALRGLQFGTVTVVIQDGCVIQIERTEKHRLRSSSRKR